MAHRKFFNFFTICSVFDAVIRLCFAHLGRALLTVLTPLKEEEKSSQQKEASKKKKPSTKPPYKYWAVHRLLVKDYLHSILAVGVK
jgi:hypothetical protein